MYIHDFTDGISREILDMKVTKAQAQANRARIVETASALFRERGYDGVGIADLMAVAGFTHGGFYKHFGSKADLLAEAATCGFAQSAAKAKGVYAAKSSSNTCPESIATLGVKVARWPRYAETLRVSRSRSRWLLRPALKAC